MKANILVVDDDSNIIKVIKDFLEMENYSIYVAEDGKTALMLLGEKIDLIILDINLPDIDGIELCKKVRNYLNVPIIFLSARIEESDKIIGLRAGGDDYIIKPFSLGELQARIEAHLRRERKKHDRRKVYSDGKLWIDYKEKKIFYNECLIGLTKSEFMIVELLSNYPTQIFDREMIYEKLWGFDKEGDNRMVTEFISRIRRKIKKFTDYEYIETVWGCGYNRYGYLGIEYINDGLPTPRKMLNNDLNPLAGVKQIELGDNYSIIEKEDKTVWSRGYNGYGQLGIGNTNDTTALTQIVKQEDGKNVPITNIKKIYAGENTSAVSNNKY